MYLPCLGTVSQTGLLNTLWLLLNPRRASGCHRSTDSRQHSVSLISVFTSLPPDKNKPVPKPHNADCPQFPGLVLTKHLFPCNPRACNICSSPRKVLGMQWIMTAPVPEICYLLTETVCIHTWPICGWCVYYYWLIEFQENSKVTSITYQALREWRARF